MNLGQNAFTVASHLTMVSVLIVLVVRLLLAGVNGTARAALGSGLTPALAIACMGLMIERLYYVVARLIKPQGIDMWSMHPAPEALSFVVGVGLFTICMPMILVTANTPRSGWTRISAEAAAFLMLWCVIAWRLY